MFLREKLRVGLNKWRVFFLVFVLVYAIILLLNLTKTPIQWDEISHLNSGSLLYYGLFSKFIDNAFYPPLFDVFTVISFRVLGISVFSSRIVSVLFTVLSLWAIFELAYHLFGGKTALFSGVLLGLMPGFFWLSGYAMLETMLMFFITAALLCFYRYLDTHNDRMLVLSGLALGLGFMVKYQILIAGVIMLLSILLLERYRLKFVFKKFLKVIFTVLLVVTPWVVIAYGAYRNGILNQWFYALQVGNPSRSAYSSRFPSPIFYLIELVWPHNDFHPISIFLYGLGLSGLVLMLWRHKREDKFVLLWFTVIYAFFTLISNREWRYVIPLFPVFAISTATMVVSLGNKLHSVWKKPNSAGRKRLAKVASACLVVVVAGAMFYSVHDIYSFTSKSHITIDIKDATNYALTNIEPSKAIMVLCPSNLFNRDMVQFHLYEKGDLNTEVYQYPSLAVDAYTPDFNITELIEQCRQYNVQYVFFFEYGGATVPYYNTTLDLLQVYDQLCESGNFTDITIEQTFGAAPIRVFIINFTG